MLMLTFTINSLITAKEINKNNVRYSKRSSKNKYIILVFLSWWWSMA